MLNLLCMHYKSVITRPVQVIWTFNIVQVHFPNALKLGYQPWFIVILLHKIYFLALWGRENLHSGIGKKGKGGLGGSNPPSLNVYKTPSPTCLLARAPRCNSRIARILFREGSHRHFGEGGLTYTMLCRQGLGWEDLPPLMLMPLWRM